MYNASKLSHYSCHLVRNEQSQKKKTERLLQLSTSDSYPFGLNMVKEQKTRYSLMNLQLKHQTVPISIPQVSQLCKAQVILASFGG